ncbi:MAG: putative transposase [Psychrobacter glaciei]|jgi:putative transposase
MTLILLLTVKYWSVKYKHATIKDKMTDSSIIASVGTTGGSYDNALAETINGAYKSDLKDGIMII